MEEITFLGRVRKANDIALLTVPMRYVRDGYVEIGKTVRITIRRVK